MELRQIEQNLDVRARSVLHLLNRADDSVDGDVAGLTKHNIVSCEVIDRVLALRKIVYGISRGPDDGAFADAYAAAIHIRLNDHFFHQDDRGDRRLYRGERKRYPATTARLYRERPDRQEELLSRLERFVDDLRAEFPWLSELEAIAVAQHYGDDARIGTWLIDFTWDPLVALAFATYQGEDGDCGYVKVMMVREWERTFGPVAPARRLKVPGACRIRNQRALFIDCAFPELLEDHSPPSVVFRQKTGLQFEDPSLGITHQMLHPTNDPIRRFTQHWARATSSSVLPAPLEIAPPWQDPTHPRPSTPPASIYAEIAAHLLDGLGLSRAEKDAATPVIERLAAFHSCLRQRSDRRVSIHSLQAAVAEAASAVIAGREPTISLLVEHYRTLGVDTDLLNETLHWAATAALVDLALGCR